MQSAIVITPKDQEELKFIAQLLAKLGIKSKVLKEEDKEDLLLSILMADVDRADTVSEEEIMKKLSSNEG